MIDYSCPNYVGDDDCHKCSRYGYIFSCGYCDDEDKEEAPKDTWKKTKETAIKADGSTVEHYTFSNGQMMQIEYDKYGIARISREVMEWLLAHADADLGREKE